ncbi:hypothetical protein [Azospirillum sp. sgz302134]
MSHRIVFRHLAVRVAVGAFPALPRPFGTRHEDVVLLLEEGGDNNVIHQDGRVSRSWSVLAAGAAWEVMRDAVRFAAACEGGGMKLRGRDTKAEAYIAAVRRAVAGAVPHTEVVQAGAAITGRFTLRDAVAATLSAYYRDALALLRAHKPGTERDGPDGLERACVFNLLDPADLQLFLCTRHLDGARAAASPSLTVDWWNQTEPRDVDRLFCGPDVRLFA